MRSLRVVRVCALVLGSTCSIFAAGLIQHAQWQAAFEARAARAPRTARVEFWSGDGRVRFDYRGDPEVVDLAVSCSPAACQLREGSSAAGALYTSEGRGKATGFLLTSPASDVNYRIGVASDGVASPTYVERRRGLESLWRLDIAYGRGPDGAPAAPARLALRVGGGPPELAGLALAAPTPETRGGIFDLDGDR